MQSTQGPKSKKSAEKNLNDFASNIIRPANRRGEACHQAPLPFRIKFEVRARNWAVRYTLDTVEKVENREAPKISRMSNLGDLSRGKASLESIRASAVGFASVGVVPRILARETNERSLEFSVVSRKGLFQHNRSKAVLATPKCDFRLTPVGGHRQTNRSGPKVCGRLRVGKRNLHVAGLVGAAMCSACRCGSHDRWP